MRLFELISL